MQSRRLVDHKKVVIFVENSDGCRSVGFLPSSSLVNEYIALLQDISTGIDQLFIITTAIGSGRRWPFIEDHRRAIQGHLAKGKPLVPVGHRRVFGKPRAVELQYRLSSGAISDTCYFIAISVATVRRRPDNYVLRHSKISRHFQAKAQT